MITLNVTFIAEIMSSNFALRLDLEAVQHRPPLTCDCYFNNLYAHFYQQWLCFPFLARPLFIFSCKESSTQR